MNGEMRAAWVRLDRALDLLLDEAPALPPGLSAEVDSARKGFSAVARKSLSLTTSERLPSHPHDYQQAPYWATHILESCPPTGFYIYARWDERTEVFLGSPDQPARAFSVVSTAGAEDDDKSWIVVSARKVSASASAGDHSDGD